jgi:acetyl-CoA synthase
MVGSVPGYALFLGGEPSQVSDLLAEIMQRKILVFVCDQSLSSALEQAGLRLDWDSGVVSLDFDHALGFIWRVAQVFGNLEVEQDVIPYVQRRLKGFSLLLGDADEEKMEKAQLAMQLGCPFLSTGSIPPMADIWKLASEETSVNEQVDLSDIVQLAIDQRGMQISVSMPKIPVDYDAAFSGQAVRDLEDGICLKGVELTRISDKVVDGRIQIVGADLDGISGKTQPYGVLVEVSGREMQPDFEPVLERQIETMFNEADGVIHRGQRTLVSLRITQKAIDKGLSLKHLGQVLHARYHNEFGNILSRVQITFFTDPEKVKKLTDTASNIYDARDQRIGDLTDEAVDTFYTCNLCQTIAAGHLCVISPEHPGACGAVDWLDARAAVSIKPVGPNKAITVSKDSLIDERLGQWESVNQMVRQESGGVLNAYSLYSLMEDPATACGDFECITAMLPLTNGVMVVEHGYSGLTPSGMDWDMLYEMVGAGMPVPGFLGHSKRALHRDKYIAAEGGFRRIVWMNHSLREELRPILEALAEKEGLSGYVDMIPTEENGTTEDEILAYISTVNHPALQLAPII